MEVGEIAFKSNFAFMDTETRIVKKRRVDREFPGWGIPLCDALTGLEIPGYPDHTVECKYATEHRCAIKVSGPRLSSFITGNDPLKDNLRLVECAATEEDADAEFTAMMMRALSDEITNQLLQHPINVDRRAKGLTYANMVTLRGAGKKLDIPTFESLHELKPFVIAPTAIIRGVGLQLGIDLLDDVEGMTGYYDSNLEGKCLRAGKEFTEN